MRIKKEILELMKDEGTKFFTNQTDTHNKWYVTKKENGANECMTAYGGFQRGPGTLRKSQKSERDIIAEKLNKGYNEVNAATFIEIADEHNLFNKTDYFRDLSMSAQKPKVTQEMVEERQSELNPTISAQDRKNFIARLNAF